MSISDAQIERCLVNAITEIGPARAELPPPPERFAGGTTEVAIAQCRQAWQQAFDACMKKSARKMSRWSAERDSAQEAAAAFRAAMPQLIGFTAIRDFVACVAYGALIDAIPPERTGQLLYAAQVALSMLPRP
jgi:hypothetical protein